MGRSDFEPQLFRACFRLFKSNISYFNTLCRDLTVFETDQFIYFIRLVAMDKTCVSPIFDYLIFQLPITVFISKYLKKRHNFVKKGRLKIPAFTHKYVPWVTILEGFKIIHWTF